MKFLSFILTLFHTPVSPITPAPWKGNASWYGETYRGKPMANGQLFDPCAMTCAAWEWPLGTVLLVTHKNRTVRVVVTDRGPAKRFPDRIIDLSRAAFARVAPPPPIRSTPTSRGILWVTVTVEKPQSVSPSTSTQR